MPQFQYLSKTQGKPDCSAQ